MTRVNNKKKRRNSSYQGQPPPSSESPRPATREAKATPPNAETVLAKHNTNNAPAESHLGQQFPDAADWQETSRGHGVGHGVSVSDPEAIIRTIHDIQDKTVNHSKEDVNHTQGTGNHSGAHGTKVQSNGQAILHKEIQATSEDTGATPATDRSQPHEASIMEAPHRAATGSSIERMNKPVPIGQPKSCACLVQ